MSEKDTINISRRAIKDEDRHVWESYSLHVKSYRKQHLFDNFESFTQFTRAQELPVHEHKSVPATAKPLPETTLIPEPDIDRKTKKKIKSGRTEIEAVIDLHGMREAEAHAAFNRFIIQSYKLGRRAVIVITGKGSGPQSEGRLRKALPIWAEMPGIGPMIHAYSYAAPEDGGTGARYILLRRNRK